MTPGTIFTDQTFVFHDGKVGNKILVSLGAKSGVIVVAKATSQGQKYSSIFGCQIKDRFPNFFLVQNCCVLAKPTWICLHEFYEFSAADLLKKHFSGDTKSIGNLPDEITVDLIECALNSLDISAAQVKILKHIMS